MTPLQILEFLEDFRKLLSLQQEYKSSTGEEKSPHQFQEPIDG